MKPPDKPVTEGEAPKSDPQRSLAGPDHSLSFGQQLSSFTELKLGKRPGVLFPLGKSPLKADQ
jgi:hypothetical protein